MFELLIGAGIGLIVGWWFFPQPQWLKDLYTKWFGGSDEA